MTTPWYSRGLASNLGASISPVGISGFFPANPRGTHDYGHANLHWGRSWTAGIAPRGANRSRGRERATHLVEKDSDRGQVPLGGGGDRRRQQGWQTRRFDRRLMV